MGVINKCGCNFNDNIIHNTSIKWFEGEEGEDSKLDIRVTISHTHTYIHICTQVSG